MTPFDLLPISCPAGTLRRVASPAGRQRGREPHALHRSTRCSQSTPPLRAGPRRAPLCLRSPTMPAPKAAANCGMPGRPLCRTTSPLPAHGGGPSFPTRRPAVGHSPPRARGGAGGEDFHRHCLAQPSALTSLPRASDNPCGRRCPIGRNATLHGAEIRDATHHCHTQFTARGVPRAGRVACPPPLDPLRLYRRLPLTCAWPGKRRRPPASIHRTLAAPPSQPARCGRPHLLHRRDTTRSASVMTDRAWCARRPNVAH